VNTLSYKTASANKATATQSWYIIDAENLVLGRLATKIANTIRGKNKADFTPHINGGDKVVVINAEKVRLTGKKLTQKKYLRHTGYPGGQRVTTPKEVLSKKPEDVINMAVKGMLPKNKLQKDFMKNLHVYAGAEHPHSAQKPKELTID